MAVGSVRALRVRDRNRLSILDAAREVLTADPDASMDDIAAEAGMVRRTVYSHFPTRLDLIEGLVRAGAEEFIADLGEPDVTTDDPATELATMVLRTWGAARRFAPVIELARRGAEDALQASMEPFTSIVAQLIDNGQRQGVFSNDLDPGVLSKVLAGSALTFLSASSEGHWSGHSGDVALTCLLLLGTPTGTAHAALAQATIHQLA
ncbi:TetR/AcrR family transcriptional regulator [Actinocorallia longicatena]|uniref:HTH tetR-type domain-containing protein n=1 Tax=Actinocorallia longicatena TaxID=111803 RepID=A0ABP6QET7_9ACTN